MIRLAAFDLDGTLTRGPTVCKVLAGPLGWRARMDEIERYRSGRPSGPPARRWPGGTGAGPPSSSAPA